MLDLLSVVLIVGCLGAVFAVIWALDRV